MRTYNALSVFCRDALSIRRSVELYFFFFFLIYVLEEAVNRWLFFQVFTLYHVLEDPFLKKWWPEEVKPL